MKPRRPPPTNALATPRLHPGRFGRFSRSCRACRAGRAGRAARAALALALGFALTSTGACKRKDGVDPDLEAERVVVDTGEACVRVGGGDAAEWINGTYLSQRWQETQKLARLGDKQASCDAAKLMKKHAQETRTCTQRVVRALEIHGCG